MSLAGRQWGRRCWHAAAATSGLGLGGGSTPATTIAQHQQHSGHIRKASNSVLNTGAPHASTGRPSVFSSAAQRRPLASLARASTPLASSLARASTPLAQPAAPSQHRAVWSDSAAVFDDLVQELTFEGRHADSLPMLNERLAKVLTYNIPTGKKNWGLSVPATFMMLAPESEHTEENLRLAYMLGWCVEMLQACHLMSDDIIQENESRRGQPCWYRVADVGLDAVSDALFIESSIYTLLWNHFQDKPYYTELVHAFIATNRHMILGHQLALKFSLEKHDISLDMYTMKTYSAIVKHKMSYHGLYFPVQLGMELASIKDAEVYRQCRTILLEMGHVFQVQNDFQDCFGDPSNAGKCGTNIQDGMCTWLICMALQKANPANKKLLRECYGIDDAENVEQVQKIYDILKLPDIYQKYKDSVQKDLLHTIDMGTGQKNVPSELFSIYYNNLFRNR